MTRRADDPFASPKTLVRLVKPDIDNLKIRCGEFLKSKPVDFGYDEQSHPDEVIFKIRISAEIPDELERDARRIIGDLRNALDQAVHAASKVLGSSNLKYAVFPVGESEAAFNGQLRRAREGAGPWCGISPELHDFLIQLRPYWGGNDLLRAFVGFSNPAKHESILAVEYKFQGVTIEDEGAARLVTRNEPSWNSSKMECEIFRVRKDDAFDADVQVPVYIALNRAGSLTGKTLASVLSDVTSIVEGIVLGLEAETARILRERA